MSRKLVEQSIINMISGSNSQYDEKRFYGNFLSIMRKHYDHSKIETAAVSITNQVNLYVNSKFFESLDEKQRIEVLEHECKHLIHYHIGRFKDYDKSDMVLWNIACDAAINEPLKSLHEMGVTVDKLNKELKLELAHNQTTEHYFEKLKEYREKNGGKGGKGEKMLNQSGDTIDDHSTWGKNDKLDGQEENVEGIEKEILKENLKKAVNRTKSKGNVPMEILQAIEKLSEPSINWKQQLQQFFAKADTFNKVRTRKKLNRRYRHLNPGRRKDPSTHIAIAIDNSGSVCDTLFSLFFTEIKAAHNVGNIRFTIIQADCEVNSVEEYDPKKPIVRTGMGGTAYMPAINKALELKVDGMIYFGDGDIFGEQLTKPRFPFLWAMEEGRDAPADWGRVCHVKYPKKS